jgi:carbonic anhydrase
MKKATWYTGFALLAASVVTWAIVAAPWATADESPSGVGKEQSPIDIVTEKAVEADLPALDFGYEASVSLEVVNTGSPDEEATIRAKGQKEWVYWKSEEPSITCFSSTGIHPVSTSLTAKDFRWRCISFIKKLVPMTY